MAFTEFYVQTTGSNLNAGSTTADVSSLTYVSGSWVQATGVFTVAAGDPVVDGVLVGDFASVYPDAATLGVFVGRVTARDATTITVSLTAASGAAPVDGVTNTTLKIGGAWRGPNAAIGFPFGFAAAAMTDATGNQLRVNFKNGVTYSITAGMTHALAGIVRFQGYTAAPGDGGRFTVDGTIVGASYILLTLSGSDTSIIHAIFQNNGTTGTASGLSITGARGACLVVTVHDIRGNGFQCSGGDLIFVECEAYACNGANTASGAGFVQNSATTATLIRCVSHDNVTSNTSGYGTASGNNRLMNLYSCIAETNGSHGILFDSGAIDLAIVKDCDCFNNGGDGLRVDAANQSNFLVENCNFVSNAGWGINRTDASASAKLATINCGFFGNTSGQVNNYATNRVDIGTITYTVTPYTNGAGGNFTVNTAEAMGTGRGTFGGFTTTVGFPDVGASQNDASTSGVPYIIGG